jgi:hypothetical protein
MTTTTPATVSTLSATALVGAVLLLMPATILSQCRSFAGTWYMVGSHIPLTITQDGCDVTGTWEPNAAIVPFKIVGTADEKEASVTVAGNAHNDNTGVSCSWTNHGTLSIEEDGKLALTQQPSVTCVNPMPIPGQLGKLLFTSAPPPKHVAHFDPKLRCAYSDCGPGPSGFSPPPLASPPPPPEPMDVKSTSCGIFNVTSASASCPAWHQHAVCWQDSAIGSCTPKCECRSGAAQKPPPPPCRPAGVFIVEQGSISGLVNAGVTVRNNSTGAVQNHLVGVATALDLASAIQRTASEVGLSASMLGGDAVRICGLNNTVSVTNGVLNYRKEE